MHVFVVKTVIFKNRQKMKHEAKMKLVPCYQYSGIQVIRQKKEKCWAAKNGLGKWYSRRYICPGHLHWKREGEKQLVSFAQWQYHNQWGFTEMWLLLVENFNQYPATKKWNTLFRQQFLSAPKRAVNIEKRMSNILTSRAYHYGNREELDKFVNQQESSLRSGSMYE